MPWIVLVASGVLEAVWAVALGRSEGFTRLTPTAVFVVALAASMAGLAYAMRSLPTGTSYAIWVGIGASLTKHNITTPIFPANKRIIHATNDARDLHKHYAAEVGILGDAETLLRALDPDEYAHFAAGEGEVKEMFEKLGIAEPKAK